MRFINWLGRASALDLAKVYISALVILMLLGVLITKASFYETLNVLSYTAPLCFMFYILNVILLRIIYKSPPSKNKYLRLIDRSGKATRWDLTKAILFTLAFTLLFQIPLYGLMAWQIGFIILVVGIPATIIVFLHPYIKALVRGQNE